MPQNTISIDRQELTTLKRKYTEAVRDGVVIFRFKNQALLTDYAKYLIQYLDSKFNSK